jgi:hypothetical protein
MEITCSLPDLEMSIAAIGVHTRFDPLATLLARNHVKASDYGCCIPSWFGRMRKSRSQYFMTVAIGDSDSLTRTGREELAAAQASR